MSSRSTASRLTKPWWKSSKDGGTGGMPRMGNLIHPSEVLYTGSRPFPRLAACEHFAGSEKLLNKALQIQAESSVNGQPVFDITADCEDGAPAGKEREHAEMIAGLILSEPNRFSRTGVRIHDVRHPAWRDELETVIGQAGQFQAGRLGLLGFAGCRALPHWLPDRRRGLETHRISQCQS